MTTYLTTEGKHKGPHYMKKAIHLNILDLLGHDKLAENALDRLSTTYIEMEDSSVSICKGISIELQCIDT